MDGNTIIILAAIGAYVLGCWWDNKLNMKQEDIIKSYFPDENKGERNADAR